MFSKLISLGILAGLFSLACNTDTTDTSEQTSSTDDNYSLEGESCEYYCYTPACNLTCEDNVIYRCQEDNLWHVEEDCQAQDAVCVTTEPDMNQAGNYTWLCE